MKWKPSLSLLSMRETTTIKQPTNLRNIANLPMLCIKINVCMYICMHVRRLSAPIPQSSLLVSRGDLRYFFFWMLTGGVVGRRCRKISAKLSAKRKLWTKVTLLYNTTNVEFTQQLIMKKLANTIENCSYAPRGSCWILMALWRRVHSIRVKVGW